MPQYRPHGLKNTIYFRRIALTGSDTEAMLDNACEFLFFDDATELAAYTPSSGTAVAMLRYPADANHALYVYHGAAWHAMKAT